MKIKAGFRLSYQNSPHCLRGLLVKQGHVTTIILTRSGQQQVCTEVGGQEGSRNAGNDPAFLWIIPFSVEIRPDLFPSNVRT